jgi:cytochrome c
MLHDRVDMNGRPFAPAKERVARRRLFAVALAIAAAATLTPSASAAADRIAAADAQRLLGQYKCYICHADHETKAGPAYVDVARYFRGRADAVPTIAREIRRGMRRGGPWHMPPHPEVSPAEAQTMARYIMSLDHAPTRATAPR